MRVPFYGGYVALLCACSALACGGGSDATESAPASGGAADAAPETSVEAGGDASQDTSADSAQDASSEVVVIDGSSESGIPDVAIEGASGDAEAGAFKMPERLVCPASYGSHSTTPLSGGELAEVSGIVASPTVEGLLWMHNDSGDEARLYAAMANGTFLGRVTLDGVDAVDWEDLAAGPCPDNAGPCLWIADTGNNTTVRDELVVYVIREPKVEPQQVFGDMQVAVPWKLRLKYPGTPIDCEAIVVAPDGSALYLLEKVDAWKVRVFRYAAPFDELQVRTVEEVASFTSPGVPVNSGRMVTAADLHTSGSRMLLRVYTGIYEYRFATGEGIESIGKVVPKQVVLGPFDEPQGEAVAYDSEGSGVWSISEANGGAVQPLHHYSCTATPEQP